MYCVNTYATDKKIHLRTVDNEIDTLRSFLNFISLGCSITFLPAKTNTYVNQINMPKKVKHDAKDFK